MRHVTAQDVAIASGGQVRWSELNANGDTRRYKTWCMRGDVTRDGVEMRLLEMGVTYKYVRRASKTHDVIVTRDSTTEERMKWRAGVEATLAHYKAQHSDSEYGRRGIAQCEKKLARAAAKGY